MRLIQVLVQNEYLDDITDILYELDVDPVVLSVDRRNASLVVFPVPTGAVDEIIDDLQDVGIDTDNYTVIIELDSAITPHLDALEKQYTEGPEAETRVSYDELRTTAREIEPDRPTFVAQIVLSTAVAAAGLLLNSAVVIVGAMVISPFPSPLFSVALGAIISDRDLLIESTRSQAIGSVIAVLTGGGVGLLTRWSARVPPNHTIRESKQIIEFTSPNLLLVLIAFAAGCAGAFVLATNQETALVGVAVAAALVPAAAAVGISLAWWELSLAAGALILLTANILLINVTSYITFILLGYQ